MRQIWVIAGMVLLGAPLSASAQDGPPRGWSQGPHVGSLGSEATISVPAGMLFLDAAATKAFLEANQNIPDGGELGTIIGSLGEDRHWFAVFSYSPVGYVDDDDRDDIDADGLMDSMLEGNRHANDERRKRGWRSLTLEGWHQRPFYDMTTNNLTWSTKVASENGRSINHSVRLLGRGGYMSVQLVAPPESLGPAVADFNAALQGFTYQSGRRYAEFQKGDKLAGYGLAGLIGAGAAGVAIKTGILQKFWKLIVVGLVVAAGAIRKFFAMLFGRKRELDDSSEAPGSAGG